jgi:membrane-associated phospholipid phosphatase
MSSLVLAAFLAALAQQPTMPDQLAQAGLQTAPQAQPAKEAPPPRAFVPALLHNLVDDVKHIPRRNTVYWLAAGAAATAAVHPADKSLNARLVGSDFADSFFKPGHVIGGTPVQLAASAVTYIVGAVNKQPRVRHLGMDLLEAQILSEGISQGIKRIVRRERPDGSSGFSFPSGHATITMASATVLQQHLGWKAAVPTYAIAAYVSASRLHDNRHVASDVVAGATTGIIIGRAVTWHGRNTWAMAPSFGPGALAVYLTHK